MRVCCRSVSRLLGHPFSGPSVFWARYACDTCKCKQDAHRVQRLRELPPILIVSLGRHEFDMKTYERYKLTHDVRYPLTLDMSCYREDGHFGKVSACSYATVLPPCVLPPRCHSAALFGCGGPLALLELLFFLFVLLFFSSLSFRSIH